VGLERGPLSLVNNFRSYLNEKVAAPGLESRKLRSEGFVALTTQHPLSAKKLALASLTGGDRSIGIIRWRTKTTEYFITHSDGFPF
jgi:hypothetical protein